MLAEDVRPIDPLGLETRQQRYNVREILTKGDNPSEVRWRKLSSTQNADGSDLI